ncbi:hypothetical protein [Streptomyces sp. NBC_00470]|uniref:hypothetical protein n=1 Tax=Streptomyces sp. NBC_00470 TaxID=2975753 RepID=UPI002F91038A
MPASSIEHTARPRKRRARSRNTNARPALALSTLLPNQYDLRPECTTLECPDCGTLVPITDLLGKKQKLVPHDTGRAGRDVRIPCHRGSNRQVVMDVEFEEWRELLEDGSADTASRRSARQHHEPQPSPGKPVTKMKAAPMSATDALTAYREHIQACFKSNAAKSCAGSHRCAVAVRLGTAYERLLRAQLHRDRTNAILAKERARFDRSYAKAAVQDTEATLARHYEATTDARRTTAKRSGTAVEETNNSCRIRPTGSVSVFRGPQVPLETLRINA